MGMTSKLSPAAAPSLHFIVLVEFKFSFQNSNDNDCCFKSLFVQQVFVIVLIPMRITVI